MAGGRPTSRKKILAAAVAVARESGPGNVSLDAVAGRAGVSKGGLLYNFPTKAKLMQALVAEHLEEFEAALARSTASAKGAARGRQGLLAAYVRLSEAECEAAKASASWLLAAMAEDPDFLAPIKAFKRRLLDRLKPEAPDVAGMLVAFLALEGLRSMKLFGLDVLTEEERETVFHALLADAEAAA